MHLFVYGTLQPNQKHFPELSKLVRSWRRARAPGWQLWHLSGAGYPAVTRSGDGEVVGTLLEFDAADAANVLEICDRIEEYSPDDPDALYLRELTSVWCGQDKLDAYIYYWNPSRARSLERHGERVDTGDWLAFCSH